MLELVFMPKAINDLGYWIKNDLKTLKKIYSLLENMVKTPFEGLGQPEPLKANYSGYWSRRINLEHRIVYKVEEERIIIHSIVGHYQ
ncbi:MAG: Txe/YoeB family addiction module toxin [Fibromonadaceae bacterium]|jgi:toxin YoeB|nr:Txe/YoeB family addiction module toxin [Fibromonadaceae bacterium]